MLRSKYICLIENKTYGLDSATVEAIIKMAKEKYKKEDKHAIVAVEKEDCIDLKKETFLSYGALKRKIDEYSSKGFIVHYV